MFKKKLLLLLFFASTQLLSMNDGGRPAKKQKVITRGNYDSEQIGELIRLSCIIPSLRPEEIKAGMEKFNREHGKN